MLPVSLRRDVVDRLEQRRVGAEQRVDLGLAPDVELALLAFAVSVERGRERALAGEHLARQPLDRLLGAAAEQRILGVEPDLAEQLENLRIVVEHFLEVRREPALVRRVARIAAAEVIVDAALAHALHREQDGGAHELRAGAPIIAPEHVEHGGVGKFRRATDAAVLAVDLVQQGVGAAGDLNLGDLLAGLRLAHAGKRALQRLAVLADLLGLAAIGLVHHLQHLAEARPAPTWLRRKIGAAPEGLALRRQEHGERPAAVLTHERERALIDRIEVGAFLAIELDVDVELVHERCGVGVLEAFMRHDVAPMA